MRTHEYRTDLEAADAWCREHGATVRYVAPEDGPFAVEVMAERSARSYHGRGGSLPEAVQDARIRHARVSAVGAE